MTLREVTHEELEELFNRSYAYPDWLKAKDFADSYYGVGKAATLEVMVEGVYNDETTENEVVDVHAYDAEGHSLPFDMTAAGFYPFSPFYIKYERNPAFKEGMRASSYYLTVEVPFDKFNPPMDNEHVRDAILDWVKEGQESLPIIDTIYRLTSSKTSSHRIFIEEE